MAQICNGKITDMTNYNRCRLDVYDKIDQLKSDENRFQTVDQRKHESVFDMEIIKKVSKGKYKTTWRGISMMKDCFDMIIYEQLLWELRPKTIFETGAYTGACALWMADIMRSYGSPVHVHSIDINEKAIDPRASNDPDLTLKKGDATKIQEAYPPELLRQCAHPWMVSEDCHVDLLSVMEHFHTFMEAGDYFVIEDTSPDTPLMSGQGLLDTEYQMWGEAKMNLLFSFLRKYKDHYRVDSYYTDYFGYNGTFNWHGYIKRIK